MRGIVGAPSGRGYRKFWCASSSDNCIDTDRRGGQWGFTYDFAGKLLADTMPTIKADGQNVRPVVHFRSLEAAILADHTAGQGSSSTPAPRVLPANVRAEVTNPRGFSDGGLG